MHQLEHQPARPGLRPVHGAHRPHLISREARRAANRKESGLVDVLRCECSERDCRVAVPAAAEDARRSPERFVVAPTHRGLDRVIAAADRFFVVEARRVVKGTS